MFKNDLLAEKVAFIAGGTSGINLAIAKQFAYYGAAVCVVGRDIDKAKRAEAEIAGVAVGVKVLGLSVDVREPSQIEAAMVTASERFGAFDIVVSGAAGNFFAPAVDVSPKGFKTVVDIDLLGTYNVFHTCFKYLQPSNASLIAITAGQAVVPMPYQIHACAAKAGVNMLVKCLAMEWGPAGIRVNGISPGPVEGTEGMSRLASTDESAQQLTSRIALRRWGAKSEIADAAVYLASPMATYVSGTILDIDGAFQLGDASANCLQQSDGNRT